MPLQMDDVFRESLRRAWLRDEEKERRAEEERRAMAFARAREVAEHIKKKYTVQGIYLFGSLVWGLHFAERSDIDILIEGFPPTESYWDLLTEAEGIADPFPISIVLAESAMPDLCARAKKEGVPL